MGSSCVMETVMGDALLQWNTSLSTIIMIERLFLKNNNHHDLGNDLKFDPVGGFTMSVMLPTDSMFAS